MEKYEILIENLDFDGIIAISVVEFPAIEQDFMKFSKENKLMLAQIDTEKRIITGPALIPDKDILRLDEKGNPYKIFFSADTVKKISEQFLQKNRNNSVTLEHMISVNDISVVESWIVDNPLNDKAFDLGYKLPKGSWMISMKVNNDEVWNQIKNDAIKGFSIEGYFTQKLSMSSVINDITEEEFEQGLKEIFEIALADPLDEYYIWQLGVNDDNCPACIEHSNRGSLKLRDWLKIAIPAVPTNSTYLGFQTQYKTSPYGTFCEDKCRCRLVKQPTRTWTFPRKK